MYKYIMGKEVTMEEHMLSASEIATVYDIYSASKKPHGMLVSGIIKDYIYRNNLNLNDFYYLHDKGAMRVYPQMLWEKAMEDFVFNQKLFRYKLGSDTTLEYIINNPSGKSGYTYRYIPKQKVIDINERRK